jgi:kynurenine formamidase
MTFENGASVDFAVPYSLRPTGRYRVGALANLGQVPAARATLVVGAPTQRRTRPARLVALA